MYTIWFLQYESERSVLQSQCEEFVVKITQNRAFWTTQRLELLMEDFLRPLLFEPKYESQFGPDLPLISSSDLLPWIWMVYLIREVVLALAHPPLIPSAFLRPWRPASLLPSLSAVNRNKNNYINKQTETIFWLLHIYLTGLWMTFPYWFIFLCCERGNVK